MIISLLKELSNIEYSKIKDLGCLVVDKPIGSLSNKDSGRVIFKLIQMYLAVQNSFNAVMENVVEQYEKDKSIKPMLMYIIGDTDKGIDTLIQRVKEVKIQKEKNSQGKK